MGVTFLQKDIRAVQLGKSALITGIEFLGRAAGTGAVMALCDEKNRGKIEALAEGVTVVDLALSAEFQEQFIKSLGFPEPV